MGIPQRCFVRIWMTWHLSVRSAEEVEDSRLSTFPRGFNKKRKMLLAHFTSGTRRSRPVISLGSSRLRIFSRVGEMSRSEPSGRRL
jgi:hypothetical protein